jgi:hypothetical protein
MLFHARKVFFSAFLHTASDLLPRIGFAWSFLRDTVLRGGYGVFRLPAIGFSGVGPASQYAQVASFTSLDNNVTPRYTLAQGVPPIPYNVDSAGNPNIPASLTNPTQSPTQLEFRARTPYNQTWQLGVQHQFKGNWLAEMDYVGTRGVKLPMIETLNQLPFSQWGPGNRQSLRPFPQYLNVSWLLNDSNSFYNSLQTSLNRRWTNGVLSFAYTWAKITADVDGSPVQDIYNLKAEHGIASYDVPHRFVANYVYRIPLGRDGKLLNGIPAIQDIVRGWEFSGIAPGSSITSRRAEPAMVSSSGSTCPPGNNQRPSRR